MSMSESSSLSSKERSSRDELEVLKADLASLKEDFQSLAGHAGEAVTERGKVVRDQVQSQIEEHPFVAVGVALGAGLLLGALIARR
jgi:ElaB/YqjD/DUF883 family membrane-anchored ribosome-binding protein